MTTDVIGAIVESEIAALVVAIGNMVGTPQEAPLVSLLRRLDPENRLLSARDAIVALHVSEPTMARVTPESLTWKQLRDALYGDDLKLRALARDAIDRSVGGNSTVAIWPLCRALNEREVAP